MSWLGQILWRAAQLAGAHPRDPLIAEWFGAASRTKSGAWVTPDTALQVAAVYACVRVLAETVASLPLIVYRRLDGGAKERDPEHPLYRLLHDQPNRWQTAAEWREQMMAHLLLRGNAYNEIISSGRRAIDALIPLDPRRVTPVLVAPDGTVLRELRSDAQLVYWLEGERGGPRVLLSTEVLHFRGLASNGLVGLSPIELHRETIGLALAAQEFGARFFQNDARPGGLVKIPGTFKDEEAIKRFRDKWSEAHAGANRGRPAVLEGGAEWVEVGMSNEDAQFLETRNYQTVDIARIYRVPPHMIGDLSRATFSNIEHQAIEFVRHTMVPWLVRLEQAMTRDLFQVAEWRRTHSVEFLADGLLRGDTISRFRAYSIARQWGWMSANDVRRKENENPIEGGDLYLSPMNMVDALKNTADQKDDDDPPAKSKGNGDARSPQ